MEDAHDHWLALRRLGLGGSDIAAVAGLSRYKTPLQVYFDKVGGGRRPRPTTAMALGTCLEPLLEALYCLVYGLREGPAHPGLVVHAEEDWRRGTPDATFPAAAHGVDYKYTHRRNSGAWGVPGTDDVPVDYLAQVHWYMDLCGARTWDLAVLVGGEEELAVWALRALMVGVTSEALRDLRRRVDFRVYCLRYDAELAELLIREGRRFWQEHVLPRQPPPLETVSDALDYVQARYPQVTAPMREASPAEQDLVRAYADAAAEEAAWKAEKDRLEPLLKDAIGPARGLLTEGWQAVWSGVSGRPVVDWKGVALAAGASPELVAAHTVQLPDSRRFQVSRISDRRRTRR